MFLAILAHPIRNRNPYLKWIVTIIPVR